MSNLPRSIILLVVLMLAGLLMSSCGSEPKSNQSTNQTRTAAPAADKDDEDACKADITTRAALVSGRLNHWIDKDDQLRGRIQLDVVAVNNSYLEVFMSGEARGEDDFEDLYQIVRKFMHKTDKKGCVRKVKFVAPGTQPMPTRAVAFEWSACKYPPDVVCSSGECHAEPCPLIVGNMNTNANANVGPNTNTNGNTNVSTNSNSNSNTGNGAG